MSDRFEYAKWQAQHNDNPEPLQKELVRLKNTRVGKEIAEAEAILGEGGEVTLAEPGAEQ